MAQLSELDTQLVAALQAAPRAPWSAIAKAAGTTETTAARRATRLQEDGVLRLAAIRDPARCGLEQPVLVQLACDPGAPQRVAAELAARSDVRFCGLTTGTWDVVAELVPESREALGATLIDEIGRLAGVRESSTALVTRTFKWSYDWSRELLVDPEPVGAEAEGPGVADLEQDDVVDLSDADNAIIDALADNARRPYSELAGIVGISESAARRRLDRLIEQECVRFCAYVEPEALGFHLEALVWLQVSLSEITTVARRLSECREVRYLSTTAGSSEIVCEIVLREQRDLYRFTTEVLGRLAGVNSAQVGVEIGSAKRAWHSPPRLPNATD